MMDVSFFMPPRGRQSDAERLLGAVFIIPLPPAPSMVVLQVRSTVWINLQSPSRFFCESVTAFIFRSGGWIRLLILIPRVVPLSVVFIGYGRIQYIILMAVPSLRGRCVDIYFNDGT
jgi:hypothetical protein